MVRCSGNNTKLAMALMLSTAVLTGCGGGGGSSSSGSGTPSSSNISFPTNAVLAPATLENGQKVEGAAASNQSDGMLGLNSVNGNPELNIALLGHQVSSLYGNYTKDVDLNTYSLNETVNQTNACTNSGSVSLSFVGDDETGGVMTLTANQCNDGYTLTNGSIEATLSTPIAIPDSTATQFSYFSMKFMSDYSVRYLLSNETASISKNSEITQTVTAFDTYGYADTFQYTMSIQATNGSESYGMDGGVFYFDVGVGMISMYQTQGRVYIDNLASYVDYDTSYDMSATPYVFGAYTGTIYSGEARYNMASGGKVKIVVESQEPITYVDAEGDGDYELSES